MSEPITLANANTVKARFGKLSSAAYRNKMTACCALAAVLMVTTPAFCAGDFDDVVTALVGFIYDLARVVGIVLAINGAFNWLLANKDENADGQSRGIKLVVVGLALVFMESLAAPILKAAGF